jgi:hypothetical protein
MKHTPQIYPTPTGAQQGVISPVGADECPPGYEGDPAPDKCGDSAACRWVALLRKKSNAFGSAIFKREFLYRTKQKSDTNFTNYHEKISGNS